MKRDMDLARQILEQIEASSTVGGWIQLSIPDRTSDEVSYHIKQLNQAGMIDADDVSTMSGFDWRAKGLTWEGHEFLDNVRNETVWRRVKATIQDKGGTASFEIIKELAIEIAKSVFLPGGGAR